jgi:FlaA1/EpsC-like NDP-sugar epimerase
MGTTHSGIPKERATLARSQNLMEKLVSGTTILITGAGGSIGPALVKALLGLGPHRLVLVDHSERNLYEIDSELSISGGASYTAVVGDVCDVKLMKDLVEQHQPGIAYHAAAFKHVPLMEANPFATVRNNALGTVSLARVCQALGVPNLVVVSTDKAVNPISIMGASKRIAELAILNLNSSRNRMSAVRLGNVLGSQGSVVPTFVAQIERGGPVTVTHPEVSRYFLTMGETVELILLASRLGDDGGIFVPRLTSPVKIVKIAREMIDNARSESASDVSVIFTGLRPGDKMSEEFLYEDEFAESTSDPRLFQVKTRGVPTTGFDRYLDNLVKSVAERNLSSMIETVCQIVPDYRPTELLDHSKRSSFV